MKGSLLNCTFTFLFSLWFFIILYLSTSHFCVFTYFTNVLVPVTFPISHLLLWTLSPPCCKTTTSLHSVCNNNFILVQFKYHIVTICCCSIYNDLNTIDLTKLYFLDFLNVKISTAISKSWHILKQILDCTCYCIIMCHIFLLPKLTMVYYSKSFFLVRLITISFNLHHSCTTHVMVEMVNLNFVRVVLLSILAPSKLIIQLCFITFVC